MMPGVVYNKDRVMGKECDCGKELLHLPRNQAGGQDTGFYTR